MGPSRFARPARPGLLDGVGDPGRQPLVGVRVVLLHVVGDARRDGVADDIDAVLVREQDKREDGVLVAHAGEESEPVHPVQGVLADDAVDGQRVVLDSGEGIPRRRDGTDRPPVEVSVELRCESLARARVGLDTEDVDPSVGRRSRRWR